LRYGRGGTRAAYFRACTTASPIARTPGLSPAGVLLPSCNQTPKAPDARCPTRQEGCIAMRCIGAGPAVFFGGGDAAPEAAPRARAGACPPACRTVVRRGGLTLGVRARMLTGWYLCSGTMYARCALLACIAAASAFQTPTPLGLRSRASLAPSVRQQRRCDMPQTPLCHILRVLSCARDQRGV
jgi:hypothetical protein